MSRRILLVSGSDPTGISGLKRDCSAVESLGGSAVPVIASLIMRLPDGRCEELGHRAEFVAGQVEHALRGAPVQAARIGAPASAAMARALARLMRAHRVPNVILDATRAPGAADTDADTLRILRQELLPLTSVLVATPHEIELLLGPDRSRQPGQPLTDRDMRILRDMGAGHVLLVDGGCSREPANWYNAVLEGPFGLRRFHAERHPDAPVSLLGAGFAAAIAALLPDHDTAEAVFRAKAHLTGLPVETEYFSPKDRDTPWLLFQAG